MSWFTALRRWFEGRPPPPPEPSGETSVLFCLQSKSPLTFEDLQRETRIASARELSLVLESLLASGRITEGSSHLGGRLYYARYPK